MSGLSTDGPERRKSLRRLGPVALLTLLVACTATPRAFDAVAPDAGPVAPEVVETVPEEAVEGGADAVADVPESPEDALPWISATRGDDAGLFDARGRQVLLRGVNFNHLGDYFQTHPSLPTVATLGDDDWDDLAAQGANVVRLVTTWSAWQPTRGVLDAAYLARVRAAIAEANEHDVYVVLDLHQDAWSKVVFTPPDEVCPTGTSHQRGWDGAPAWATFTDGAPTCTPGGREESPAVRRAWDNFYANRDGIRDELAGLWGQLAAEFADQAGVAGFDLLNEPGTANEGTSEGLTAFYRSAITAIRAAEAGLGARSHVVFFEPSVHGLLPEYDLSDDPALVFAAHNYFESIGPGQPGSLERSFTLYDAVSRVFGTALWIGEYGHFGDDASNNAWMERFAVGEDGTLVDGGTWWQWEQACGDPHSVQYPPSPAWLAEQVTRCANARFTPTLCVRRAYPRAAPGRLVRLADPACDGHLSLEGATPASGVADLWIPSASDTAPVVSGPGVVAFESRRVPGGWRLAVTVEGTYALEVEPGAVP